MKEIDVLLRRYDETKEEVDQIVLQPFEYIQKVPGKNIRSKLVLALNHWFKVPQEKIEHVTSIIQIIHTASLMQDDIQDDSKLRRGLPTAHLIYGMPVSLNSANFSMYIAMDKVLQLNNIQAAIAYNELVEDMHRGQGMELFWRDNFICPSEEDYKLMVMRKTGALFLIAARLLSLYSDFKGNLTRLITILGIYFQIRDDYCSLCHLDYAHKKSYCEDLTEGKFSFPLIHAINHDTHDHPIMNILRKRTTELEVKRYCVGLMESYGSFLYTRAILEDLEKAAYAEIKRLNGNPAVEEILNSLNDWKSVKHPIV